VRKYNRGKYLAEQKDALRPEKHALFEVECKISEWMLSKHYKSGKHCSGTVGTFGAYAAAAKLLGLTGDALSHAAPCGRNKMATASLFILIR
jgi:2-methylcitrate dehydratase PrpD